MKHFELNIIEIINQDDGQSGIYSALFFEQREQKLYFDFITKALITRNNKQIICTTQKQSIIMIIINPFNYKKK